VIESVKSPTLPMIDMILFLSIWKNVLLQWFNDIVFSGLLLLNSYNKLITVHIFKYRETIVRTAGKNMEDFPIIISKQES
jgi:hypothetical protein